MTSRKHILVVDDDTDGLFLIGKILRQTFPHAEILQAGDGTEALAILTRTQVDAVVTDNKMSAMSGLEMVRQIRRAGSPIPIIMLTGSDEIEKDALDAGVTVFHRTSDWSNVGAALQQYLKPSAGD